MGITQKKIVRRIFKKGECKGDVVYRDDWLAVVVRRYVFLSRACVFDRFLAVDLTIFLRPVCCICRRIAIIVLLSSFCGLLGNWVIYRLRHSGRQKNETVFFHLILYNRFHLILQSPMSCGQSCQTLEKRMTWWAFCQTRVPSHKT